MLKPSHALPSALAVAAISPASLASTSVIVATLLDLVLVLVLVVHLVPCLRAPLPASGRRAWRVVLALATVEPKEVNIVAFSFQFYLGPLLCLFYSY